MTNEEAIKHITKWLYAAPDVPPMQVVQALELAVAALRAGGKGMNVPTMPAGHPLTLEQLRGMEGQKVLIYRMKSTEPLEPGTVRMNGGVLGDNGTLAYHELYLLTWVAFSYPTAYLDREAWTSKWINSMPALGAGDLETRCKSCGNLVLFETVFCPYCGKAMTEEAWEELEKRLRECVE